MSEERKEQSGTECTNSHDRQGDDSKESAYIGDFHQAPHFMKDNDKIQQGYRINFNSRRKLFKSLFMIHNQSVNIWSHLISFLVVVSLLVSFYFVIDDHEFRKTVQDYKKEIEYSYLQYQSMLRNLSLAQNFDRYNYQSVHQIQQLKGKIMVKYNQIFSKIDNKANQLNALLDENIQGLKESFKQELKIKIAQIEKFKRNYQEAIAPDFVKMLQREFHSQLLDRIRTNVDSLKNHVDSAIFSLMELHPEVPNPMFISRWPLFIFLSTAVLCLLFSTIFHLFYPLSKKAYGLLLRFDFAGISLLMAGSSFPPFYYGMYCTFAVAEIYLTLIVMAATTCFVIGLFQFIHKHQNAVYRSIIFGTFGISLSIPLIHLAINEFIYDNYGDPYKFSSSYPFYIFAIASYITGLYIFTVKCPERNSPGKYDICGHSHQIWHFLVVMGIVGTYFGALQNFQMRKQSICPA